MTPLCPALPSLILLGCIGLIAQGVASDGECSGSSSSSPMSSDAELQSLATAEMQDAVRTILQAVGEDPDRKVSHWGHSPQGCACA